MHLLVQSLLYKQKSKCSDHTPFWFKVNKPRISTSTTRKVPQEAKQVTHFLIMLTVKSIKPYWVLAHLPPCCEQSGGTNMEKIITKPTNKQTKRTHARTHAHRAAAARTTTTDNVHNILVTVHPMRVKISTRPFCRRLACCDRAH